MPAAQAQQQPRLPSSAAAAHRQQPAADHAHLRPLQLLLHWNSQQQPQTPHYSAAAGWHQHCHQLHTYGHMLLLLPP
jgi:hypothetical protein